MAENNVKVRSEMSDDGVLYSVFDVDMEILTEVGLLNQTIASIVSNLRNNNFCQISLISDQKTINDDSKALQETLDAFCMRTEDLREVFAYEEKAMPINLSTFKDAKMRGIVISIVRGVLPCIKAEG